MAQEQLIMINTAEEEEVITSNTSDEEYMQKLRDEAKVICQKLEKMGEDSIFLTANSSEKFCNFFGSSSGEEFLINRIQVVKEFYTFCAGVALYKSQNGMNKQDEGGNQEVNGADDDNSNQINEDLTEETVEVINRVVSAGIRKVASKKDEIVIYKCTMCDTIFQANQTLQKHIIAKHNGVRSHPCVICKKKFYTEFDLKNHLTLHGIGEKQFECHLCGKKFSSQTSVLKHIRTHNSSKSYTCKQCGFEVKDLSIYRRHIIQHNMTNYASQAATTSDDAQTKGSISEENAGNTQTSSDMESETKKDKHEQTGKKKKPTYNFSCKHCGGKFQTGFSLKRHTAKCKSSSFFSCDKCNATFTQVYSLEKHKKMKHKISDRFYCETCGESFKHKFLLIRHKKILCNKQKGDSDTQEKKGAENVEMIFKCNDCGTHFEDADSVQKHIDETNSQKLTNAFKCDKCCKRFLTKRLLSKHVASHDQGLHKCEFCDKTFVTTGGLVQHMESETHFKFTCETCGQQFPTGFELKSHTVKVHYPRTF